MTESPARLLRGLGAAAALALVAGCGPTPYEPATGLDETGFRTSLLGPERYQVGFEGNAATPRRTVETYMLYRAAEVAKRTGHPYFAIVTQETERDIDAYYTHPGFYGYGPTLGMARTFRFPYYSSADYTPGPMVTTTDAYEAFATVEMLEQRSAGRQGVFETAAVLDTLRPHIETAGR